MTANSKYYGEHKRIFNILKFTLGYVLSTFWYLLMDYEIFINSGFLHTSLVKPFAKVVSNVILKRLTILSKTPVLECLTLSRIWLCTWIQHNSQNANADISLSASKEDTISSSTFSDWNLCLQQKLFSFRSLRISQPLKELTKVSLWWHSQEYLFANIYTNYHQNICGRVGKATFIQQNINIAFLFNTKSYKTHYEKSKKKINEKETGVDY